MKAQFFAQTNDSGKLISITDAYPPHTLTRLQFELTKTEYELLRALGINYSVDQAIAVLMAFEEKREKHVANIQSQ